MIKISFSIIKRKPVKKGVIRLKSLSSCKKDDRFKNNQLVITRDGIGTIKEQMVKKDEDGKITSTLAGINIAVRNLAYGQRIYNPKDVNVVDIIEVKSGNKYPAIESDYSLLLLDDALVEFIVTRRGKAMLTERSRKQLDVCKIFTKKQNGIRLFNELIEKGIWNPLKK